MRADGILGSGYAARDVNLPSDSAGPSRAVLLHRVSDAGCSDAGCSADARASRVPLLALHGWSDYMFDRDLFEHLAAWGFDVWALDLRRHGRAIDDPHDATRIDHLNRFDEEIGAALAQIRESRSLNGSERGSDVPEHAPVILAHSMGGLIAALYAQRHPGAVRALALNAPWLEMHGGALVRRIVGPVIACAGRILRSHPVLPAGPRHYARAAHREFGGEHDYDLTLKPPGGHPMPAETLAAVLDGQRRLARNGPLTLPILVMCSDHSRFGLRFHDSMRRADTVLDVRTIRARARTLGPSVQIVQIPGARHDVFLSRPDARAHALEILHRWCETEGLLRPTMRRDAAGRRSSVNGEGTGGANGSERTA